jgi:hypothetical protein
LEVHHKPKPWHGWREFLKEYGIIVLGVLTALGAEQLVETLHWRHKVDQADGALRRELEENVGFASVQQSMNACSKRYADILEAAVIKNRPDVIEALHKWGMPLSGRPWHLDTWTAALDAQIPDRLPPETVQAYSLAFHLVSSESSQQYELIDLYGQSWTGRFGHLDNPVVATELIRFVDQIRVNETRRFNITRSLLTAAQDRLNVKAPSDALAQAQKEASECEAMLNAIPKF